MLTFAGTSRGVSVDLSAGSWSYVTRIMPLGDSITAGWGSPQLDGYRGPLWRTFMQNGMAVDYVGSSQSGPSSLPDRDHQGTPGQRADQLAPLVPGLMTKYNPDIVLLMIGANDLEQEHNGASTLKADIDQILGTIGAQLPNTTVFVSTLTPIRPDVSGSSSVPAANAAIRAAVTEAVANGHHVNLVEPKLSLADIADEDHPTAAGHAKLARSWYNAVVADLPANGGTPGGQPVPVSPGESRVTGSEVNDRIVGDEVSNVLMGRKGHDFVFGGGGNDFVFGDPGDDRLFGGTGNDTLRGDKGQDLLSGGPGNDRFVFTSVSTSPAGARDSITDFQRGDLVDLSNIDANTQVMGNQSFKIVSEFTGSEGQLQWNKTSSGFLVSADVNGDGQADFAVALKSALTALHGHDFLL